MIRALRECYDEFREGDSLYAAKKFNEADRNTPDNSIKSDQSKTGDDPSALVEKSFKKY